MNNVQCAFSGEFLYRLKLLLASHWLRKTIILRSHICILYIEEDYLFYLTYCTRGVRASLPLLLNDTIFLLCLYFYFTNFLFVLIWVWPVLWMPFFRRSQNEYLMMIMKSLQCSDEVWAVRTCLPLGFTNKSEAERDFAEILGTSRLEMRPSTRISVRQTGESSGPSPLQSVG